MRIFDRYCAKQLLPVWIWCLVVFIFLSCLIDLFGHLDEILRYRIQPSTLFQYYLNFTPYVFVRAAPLALLLSTAFVTGRLSRYQEFLAMNASGVSLMRASVPFLFIGWLISILVFSVNERVVPPTYTEYERIQKEAFRTDKDENIIENVAVIDSFNRIYHARSLNISTSTLENLTIIEHNWENSPTKSLYASKAVWTKSGWYLIQGSIHRLGQSGALRGEPQPFVDRLITYPVTIESFTTPESRPEIMRYGQLRMLILRLKQTGITNVRRFKGELWSKLTVPFMCVVICLIGFVGSTQPSLRGNLQGLGLSLGWGMLYYLGSAAFQGIAKQWPVPIFITIWIPHVFAIWWCFKKMLHPV